MTETKSCRIETAARLRGLLELPPALRDVVAAAAREEGPREIAERCKEDLSLAARVLAIASSRVFGGSGTISSLTRAAVSLGVNGVRNVAVISYLRGRLPARLPGFEIGRWWRHSFATAGIARALASAAPDISSEDAYLVGLLHDVGAILLWELFPGPYPGVFAAAARGLGSLEEIERREFGLDHREVSALAVERWPIPPAISSAIAARASGETSDASPESSLGASLRVASGLGRRFGCALVRPAATADPFSLPSWCPGRREEWTRVAREEGRRARDLDRILTVLG